jgi:dTDP-4-dehydrorhamnose reductase
MVASIKELSWLIVGSKGQLGLAMQNELSVQGVNFRALGRSDLDITNADKVLNFFEEIGPEVVINTAGWTDVDGAELNEDKARSVNSYGPRVIAESSRKIGAKHIHISSDYVFSGNSRIPWSEDSTLSPLGAYGRTKAEGEKLVQQVYPEGSYVVRTAWLYSPWRRNFVKSIARIALSTNAPIEVVSDQVGQPTNAMQLATRIREMVELDVSPGIYHGTNSGEATWFELAQLVFDLCGEDPKRVVPIPSTQLVRSASRPSYSVLGHQNWRNQHMIPMPDWQDALVDGIQEILSEVRLEG